MKSMRSLTITTLVIFYLSNSLFAQNTVNGILLDELTNQPIAGATIEVENTSFRVTTNEEGAFRIFVPELGTGFKVIHGKRKQSFALTRKEEVTLLLPSKTSKKKISLMAGKTVRGTVIDGETGEPIVGAHVKVENTTFRTITEEDGIFDIYIPRDGTKFRITHGRKKARFDIGESEQQLFSLVSREKLYVANRISRKIPSNQTDSKIFISSTDFKEGNLNNPIQLIQGIPSGTLITKAGDNPNEAFDIRIRGINTLSQRANPLIVIDGLPEASLESIDPMDITSIQVLKDAASTSKYGIRGASGVLEITTKMAQDSTFRINYHGYFSSENYSNNIPILSRQEFIDFNGSDFGSNTNWLEEITQNGVSAASHLSISGGKKLKYYASAYYRNVNGILKENGFENYGARVNLNYKTLQDRLQLGLLLGANNRSIDYSFPQAFRYAMIFNPTAPIFGEDNTSVLRGGFFTLNRFDYFNPVAMIDQNVNEGELKNYSATLRGSFEILKGLKINTTYATQITDDFVGQYYPSDADLIGLFAGGEARINDTDIQNFNWESSLSYEKEIGKLRTNFSIGYAYQQIEEEMVFTLAQNFDNDDFGYKNLDLAFDVSEENFRSVHDLSAYFGGLSLNYDNLIFLNANIRREGSSWLGSEEKWGVFPAVSLGMEATRFLNFEALSYLKIRSSFGIVGNPPIEGFLSKQRFQEGIIIFQNGEFNETGFFSTANANPFLAHETRRELNFGIDFGLYKNKIQGSLEFYNSKNQDLIQRNSVDSPPNFAPVSWLNSGGLSTNGLDFNLHFEMMKKADFSWNGSFQLSRFKTKVDKWGQLFPFLSMPGAPGFGSDFFVKIEEGEAIGNFYGHEFVSVGEDGFPIFRLPTNNFEDDQFILGNGLPKSSIGLRQVFNYKRFELDLFARGAFGHQMFNLPRLFYENRDRISSDANVVKTSFFDPNLRGSGVVSDLYVEDAGYLKIDYISLGYNFDLTNQQFIRNLEFYVTLQNPLIFTSYTGASPEVRLKDTGASDSGRLNGNLELAAFSIDRRNTYLPTRGWVIGLKIGL